MKQIFLQKHPTYRKKRNKNKQALHFLFKQVPAEFQSY